LSLRQANEVVRKKEEHIKNWEYQYNLQQRNLHEIEKDMLGLQSQQQEEVKQKNTEIDRQFSPNCMQYKPKDQPLNVWQKITVGFRHDPSQHLNNNANDINVNKNEEDQQQSNNDKTTLNTTVHQQILTNEEDEEIQEESDADMYTSLSTLLSHVDINSEDELIDMEHSKLSNTSIRAILPIQWFQRSALNQQQSSADSNIENKMNFSSNQNSISSRQQEKRQEYRYGGLLRLATSK